MDFRQLRTFVYVAELGSICAAAHQLNTAQSALTRQLQLLEHALDTRLLHRHGRGVSLTAKGELFLVRARQIIEAMDRAREETRDEAGNVSGVAKIGISPELVGLVAPRLLARVSRDYPGIRLQIVSAMGGDLTEWLQRGIIDVAVPCHHTDIPLIKAKPVVREVLVAIGNDERLPRSGGVALASLAKMPLVLPSQRHGLRRIMDDAAALGRFTLDPVAEVDCFHLQLSLLRQGSGVAVMPESAAAHVEDEPEIRVVPILDPEMSRQLAVAVPVDRMLSPAAVCLRDLVFEDVRSVLIARCGARHPPLRLAS